MSPYRRSASDTLRRVGVAKSPDVLARTALNALPSGHDRSGSADQIGAARAEMPAGWLKIQATRVGLTSVRQWGIPGANEWRLSWRARVHVAGMKPERYRF